MFPCSFCLSEKNPMILAVQRNRSAVKSSQSQKIPMRFVKLAFERHREIKNWPATHMSKETVGIVLRHTQRPCAEFLIFLLQIMRNPNPFTSQGTCKV